jgi:hypothetical protein
VIPLFLNPERSSSQSGECQSVLDLSSRTWKLRGNLNKLIKAKVSLHYPSWNSQGESWVLSIHKKTELGHGQTLADRTSPGLSFQL